MDEQYQNKKLKKITVAKVNFDKIWCSNVKMYLNTASKQTTSFNVGTEKVKVKAFNMTSASEISNMYRRKKTCDKKHVESMGRTWKGEKKNIRLYYNLFTLIH